MGRAIEVDKRLDAIEFKVNELFLILDELNKTATTQEHIDLHETEKKEANDEPSGDSGKQSDSGKSKPKAKSGGSTKSSK